MDGVRARRQKSGSPLGRIIDEALDTLQQTCYILWLGYLFGFDNKVFEAILLMPNLCFFVMEMKFILCKNLKMTVGDEIGPVEMELIFSFLLFVGAVFGNGWMQVSVGHTFGIEMLDFLQWKFVTGSIFLPL